MPSQPPANLPLSGDKSSGQTSKPSSPETKDALNVKKTPKTGESEPLAPKSFKNPKQKKGNGRKIMAVALGSIIVIFLIGAIGLVGFRLFTGEEEQDTNGEGRSQNGRTIAQEEQASEERPVDLGAWTSVPPCLDLGDPNVWIDDEDGDGLTNAEERLFGTDPCKADSSGDGLTDKESIDRGQDPLGEGPFDYARYGLPDPSDSE